MTTKSAATRTVQRSDIPPPPRVVRLKTLDDVRVEMARLYREARVGDMDASKAGKLAYLLTQIAALVRDTDLERRLTALEREANGDTEAN
jgi:hypothetical protein